MSPEMRRRVEITVETEVSVAVRGDTTSRREELCAECGGVTVPASVAACIASTSLREIYRMVETGQVHYVEVRGEGRVCIRTS